MSGYNQYRKVVTIPNGNPLTWHGNTEGLNGSGLLQPGELGAVYPGFGEQFQLVKMDSGATAATPTGIPAAGQIAFWKDRNNYLVTNDSRQADAASFPAGAATRDARNSVAGVVEMAVVGGEYFFVHQKGSSNVKTSTTPNPGDVLSAGTGTNADCISTAAGTAPPSQVVGTVTSATKTGGLIPAEIAIEFVD
jgi:hypothetical protein